MTDSNGWVLVATYDTDEPFVDEVMNLNKASLQTSSRRGRSRAGPSRVRVPLGPSPLSSPPAKAAPSPTIATTSKSYGRQSSEGVSATESSKVERDGAAGRAHPKRNTLRTKLKAWLHRMNPFTPANKAEGVNSQEQIVVLPSTRDGAVPSTPSMPFGWGEPRKGSQEQTPQSSRIHSVVEVLVHRPSPTHQAAPVASQTRLSFSSQSSYPPQNSSSVQETTVRRSEDRFSDNRESPLSATQPQRVPPESMAPSAYRARASPPQQTNSGAAPVRSQTPNGQTSHTPTSDMPQRYPRRSRTVDPSSQPAVGLNRRVVSADQVNAGRALRQVAGRTPQSQRNTELSASHGIDRAPPLFSEITRLIMLKDDYRHPDSTSEVIRSKINYLRFEMGYKGLRRSRADGNSFYRSFAFAYLEQIYAASDKAVAVANSLKHLKMAQNLVDPTTPGHEWSNQMYVCLRDMVQGMGQETITRRMIAEMLQYQPDSDNVAAYMQALASAYIRLTPGMNGSVFQTSGSSTATRPSNARPVSTASLGSDVDHIHVSALSRTLNVPVHLYHLNDKYDPAAPRKRDIPPDCTRFIPGGIPIVAEPVALLFRPRHYDILLRDGPPPQ